MNEMIQNYVYGNSEETFEALTLFKAVFGHLIDPNILSIQCNLIEFRIFRNNSEPSNAFRHDYFLLRDIKNLNQLLNENDQQILDAYDTIYAGKLNAFDYLEYSGIDSREPHEIRELLYAVIPYLPPIFFSATQLFGSHPFIYQMYKNHFLKLVEQKNNEKIEDIESTVKDILSQATQLAAKPAKTINNRIVRRIKQYYMASSKHRPLHIPYLIKYPDDLKLCLNNSENYWNELGNAVYEDQVPEKFKNQLEALCSEELQHLNPQDKSVLVFEALDLNLFSLEDYQQDHDLSNFVVFDDILDPIISAVLKEARKDWESKKMTPNIIIE